MANTKTPILTGTEVCLTDLGGQNVAVKNLSDGSVWASAFPNITAGADNVIEIPAGGGEVVLDARGTVYLLGTGKVQCTGTNYATPNFRVPSSSSGGGGGTGDVTKAYVDAQDSNTLGAAKAYTNTAVNAVKADVTTNTDDIADLQTDMTVAQNAITANSTAIATVQTAAANAKSVADSAQTAADTAQTTATTAQATAEVAQTAATGAQTTANTAKSTADAAQTAASAAQSTADAAQAAADTNAANITSTAASTLKSAKTYTDTQTDALDTRITATETAITTLNGTGAGSVSKAVSDGIAEVVAGAPASFDTLKEISDWISGHSDSAAEMNSQIQTNAENIADLETDKADKSEIPTTLPANGGDSDTVNGHTVNMDVPENAKFTDTTYSNMTGATASAAGKSGLVPAPVAGSQAASFLKASGAWASPLTPVLVAEIVDLDDFTASGCYYFASNNSPANAPAEGGNGWLFNSTLSSSRAKQIWFGVSSESVFVRTKTSSSTWHSWRKLLENDVHAIAAIVQGTIGSLSPHSEKVNTFFSPYKVGASAALVEVWDTISSSSIGRTIYGTRYMSGLSANMTEIPAVEVISQTEFAPTIGTDSAGNITFGGSLGVGAYRVTWLT